MIRGMLGARVRFRGPSIVGHCTTELVIGRTLGHNASKILAHLWNNLVPEFQPHGKLTDNGTVFRASIQQVEVEPGSGLGKSHLQYICVVRLQRPDLW